MKRLTRRDKIYECRAIDCKVEGWNDTYDPCFDCPFMEYINRLAELEDHFEELEDDGK